MSPRVWKEFPFSLENSPISSNIYFSGCLWVYELHPQFSVQNQLHTSNIELLWKFHHVLCKKNPPILLDWSVDSSGSINQRIYRNLWNPLRYSIWALHTFRLKKIERPKETLLRPQTLDSVGQLSDVNLIQWFSGCSVPKPSSVRNHPLFMIPFDSKKTSTVSSQRNQASARGIRQIVPDVATNLRSRFAHGAFWVPLAIAKAHGFSRAVLHARSTKFGRRSLARHSELRWRCHECCNLHQATISWVTVIDCGFEQATWWLSLLSI